MLYVILRGCWYDIVQNVHAPTEDQSDDTKVSFCEELGRVFSQFLKYHMKMFGDFNAQVGREDIFKPTVRNEHLYEIDNGLS
jgi:hypothetical protein